MKDYHIGRFLDHFRTEKGRKLIFPILQIIKVFFFVLLVISSSAFDFLFYCLILIYCVEVAQFILAILKKNARIPVLTFKAFFLTAIMLAFVGLSLIGISAFKDSTQLKLFLGFDILTPIFVSIVVLLFQPFFVLLRNATLKKAEKLLQKIKLVSGVKVIAITGSYGKTSTKEFLTTILSRKFKVLSTSKHQNSEIGVAKCILKDLRPNHQVFIAEVGAYDKGKVKQVCNILKPKIGIVTGVNEQHLALFGSMQNLLSAEGGGELADSLPKDGVLFINGDNKYCLDLYKKNNDCRKKIYCLSNKIIDSEIWADDIVVSKNYVSFIATCKNANKEWMSFTVRVLGKHNIQNLLGAILVAKELGMSLFEIAEACKSISQEQAGITLKQGNHDIFIIDSSYSSNPDGVFADLDYFSVFGNPTSLRLRGAKKVIVMPCLIELGEKSSEIHKKIGQKIAETCDFAIITSKDKFQEIKNGAVQAGMAEKNILLCDKPQDIYSLITLFCKAGDAVLLEGRVPNKLHELL